MPPHSTYIEAFLGGGAVMRHKRSALCNIGIDLDEHVIRRWRGQELTNCELRHEDAFAFLEGYPFVGTEAVYCDPPYLASTRRAARLYRHELSVEQHQRLLHILLGLKCYIIISGCVSDLYNEQLREWVRLDLENFTRVGRAHEALWLNYTPVGELHDYRFLGGSFRERQRISRRLGRLTGRLLSLPPAERNALRSRVWPSAGGTGAAVTPARPD